MRAALAYAARGWRVIPIKPGLKHPTMKGWPDLATTDLGQVEKWWGSECVGWGIGLALGPESGVFAVDVDPRNDGWETLYAYECATGRGLIPTLTNLSGRGDGGHHLLYRYPADRKVKNNGQALRDFRADGASTSGVEVKSQRTQIVLPPTFHPATGEPYRWLDPDADVVNAPGWMLDDLLGKSAPSSGGSDDDWGYGEGLTDADTKLFREVTEHGATCPPGSRDIIANARAYQLRKLGTPRDVVFKNMRDMWLRFEQPWGDEYAWEMVAKKVDDAFENHQPDTVIDWKSATLLGSGGDDEEDERATRLVTAAERRSRPDPVWRVVGLAPEYGLGVLYGATYVGRTFVALDLSLSMCNALADWHGHAITQPGDVVYALMEGAFDFQRRVEAWVAGHPGTTDDRLFTLEEEELDLGSAESLKRLVQDIEQAMVDPTLVVVDTQGLATPGRNEDKSTDMNLVYALHKRLAKRLGCFVLLVHHTGWDDSRVRGSSAQKQAADLALKVSHGIITVEKVKAGPSGRQSYFTLEPSVGSVWARPVDGLTVAIKQQHADERLRRQIVDYVRLNPSHSKSVVAKAMGGKKEDTTAVVESLVGDALEDRGGKYSKLYIVGATDEK